MLRLSNAARLQMSLTMSIAALESKKQMNISAVWFKLSTSQKSHTAGDRAINNTMKRMYGTLEQCKAADAT